MVPTTAVQCCLARQAKGAPEEFPFRQIVPVGAQVPGRWQDVAAPRSLHKFECGLQTRPRPGPPSPRRARVTTAGGYCVGSLPPLPGSAKAKELRPREVN